MDEILFSTIRTVFALAQMQGKKLCFSPSDGQFYEVAKRDNESCTLYPLGGVGDNGEASPIFYLNPAELIFREDLVNSPNIAFQTLRNAITTRQQRDDNADESQFSTQPQRAANAQESQNNRAASQPARSLIGSGKADLPRFAHNYTGEIGDKCAEIEGLLDNILKSTNYPPTIRKTIENYHTAKQLAQTGNLYELATLTDRLKGRIRKQAAMSAAMGTVTAQQVARRRMTFAITLLILIVSGYFALKFAFDTEPEPPTTEAAAAVTTSEPQPQPPFEAAIEEWQRINNRRIYPAGRECLRKACDGITDKNKILDIISKNMN